jgi:hypothetical protein
MKIALTLNAHEENAYVLDTIESIKKYVTNYITVIIDGHNWKNWENSRIKNNKIEGFVHNYYKAPYRNMLYSLLKTYQQYPNMDWYCYSEWDVLFTSESFKEELKKAEEEKIFCIGNDFRTYKISLPYFDKIFNQKIEEYNYLLGCCFFVHKNIMHTLVENNVIQKLLFYTNEFEKGYFPDCKEQNIYDFGELIIPTFTKIMGGKVGQFAAWHPNLNQWIGNFKKIAMRWKPEIQWEDIYKETSILHPVKKSKEIRSYFKQKRAQDGIRT